MKRIGFVGLGMMGAPMASNLLQNGFELTGFDLDSARRTALAQKGAATATRLTDLGGCDAVIVMVNTDAQAREVITELVSDREQRAPALFCMSTVLPSTVRELGEQTSAAGVGFLDAPVSGGRIVAEAGRLAIMVGGSRDLFEQALPVFQSMGGSIHHVGPLGAGQSAKLVNNSIAITTLPVVLEALRIGLAEGLDLTTLVGVIRASSGNTWLTENWDQASLLLDFLRRDPVQLDSLLETGTKDLQLAMQLCQQSGVQVPLLQRALETLIELGSDALRSGLDALGEAS